MIVIDAHPKSCLVHKNNYVGMFVPIYAIFIY
jgi:hypothetical protein